jgi:carbamoyl-phosphate synthase large subunit
MNKGMRLFATPGTAKLFSEAGIEVEILQKLSESQDSQIISKIRNREIDLVINIPKNFAHEEITDGYQIRRAAVDANVPLVTNLQVAKAIAQGIKEFSEQDLLPISAETEYFAQEK